MSKPSRRHHHVAAFHLARFTESGGQGGTLHVYDLQRRQRYQRTPKTTGHERDFYRIDVDGVDPLAFEKEFLRDVEGPAARAIERVIVAARGAVNAGLRLFRVAPEDLLALLTFMAVQAMRGPNQRASFDRLTTQLAKEAVRHLARDKAAFARRKASDPSLADLTFEDVRQMLRDPTFMLKTDTTTQLQMALPAVPSIVEQLVLRTWSIAIAPRGAPPFICTDNPVITLPGPDTPMGIPCGFATRGSSVVMPLSRTEVLTGIRPEPPEPSTTHLGVHYVDAGDVGTLNGLLVNFAHRYVYCCDDDFVLAGLDGTREGHRELFGRTKRVMRDRERQMRKAAKKHGR